MLVRTAYAEKDRSMLRMSAKRQIILPADQCQEVGIGPGDEYRSYVADGRIAIVRKTAGDPTASDEESLEDALKGHATVGRLSTIATKADGL